MQTCIFAGTFDPITIGHVDIIERCAQKYDKVLVVIGQNPNKNSMFTESQRFFMVQKAIGHIPTAQVFLYSDYKDCYANFLKEQNATVYVRGIRNQEDFVFEKQMEQKNKQIYPFITTDYLWCADEFRLVSSTLVKQNIAGGKEYLNLIPDGIKDLIQEFLKENKVK